MALDYYFVLRSVMARVGEVGLCLARCCHCGIRFLTHRRNHNRENLRCPFGCRETHRKLESAARSAAYYRTARGKFKKELLNARRGQSRASCPSDGGVPGGGAAAPEATSEAMRGPDERDAHRPLCDDVESDSEGAEKNLAVCPLESRSLRTAQPERMAESRSFAPLPPPGSELTPAASGDAPGPFPLGLMGYLQVVIGLIERRPVTLAEIQELLIKVLRQRRFGARPKREYVLSYLAENPP